MKNAFKLSNQEQGKKSRLNNIKGMLSKDQMKKVVGGYWICSTGFCNCPCDTFGNCLCG